MAHSADDGCEGGAGAPSGGQGVLDATLPQADDGDATLPVLPARQELQELPAREAGFDARYQALALLGQGGMGEVHLYLDRRVGREVAVKIIRSEQDAQGEARARFLREARVQGRLEHPSIVPVHDIGTGPGGASCFTMKRVRGATLERILAGQAAGDRQLTAAYSQRRLLSAFAQVCLAIDFAHRQGVIHRDLKPGNIMLGDFGEVYVLDWGLAKSHGERDDGAPSPVHDVTVDDAQTTATSCARASETAVSNAPAGAASSPVRTPAIV